MNKKIIKNKTKEIGEFYVVATPIGNLNDISFRAIEVLNFVDFVLAEDTRISKKLFNKFNIDAKLISYNSFSSRNKKDKIIGWLEDGKNIALISDAGTPTISDPGVKIISELYEKFNNEINIIPIPGPTALISAISVSGFSSSEFIFYGFLPHKKGREKIFKEIAVNKKTSIFYESPHRLMKSLESLIEFCEENKEIFIARELTKIYEHKIKNKVVDIKKYFKNNPDKIKGEFVVVVKGIK